MKVKELFEAKETSILSAMGKQEDPYPRDFYCSNNLTSLAGAPSVVNGGFSQFVRFCVARDTCFLPATKLTGLLWARELAARGTIKASTAHGRWHLH